MTSDRNKKCAASHPLPDSGLVVYDPEILRKAIGERSR